MSTLLYPAFINGSLGGPEVIFVFIAILLLFGPRKLPEIAKMFGKTAETLRKSAQDFKNEIMKIEDDAKSRIAEEFKPDDDDDESTDEYGSYEDGEHIEAYDSYEDDQDGVYDADYEDQGFHEDDEIEEESDEGSVKDAIVDKKEPAGRKGKEDGQESKRPDDLAG